MTDSLSFFSGLFVSKILISFSILCGVVVVGITIGAQNVCAIGMESHTLRRGGQWTLVFYAFFWPVSEVVKLFVTVKWNAHFFLFLWKKVN